MKTIKLILTAILLMATYVANAQTIQVYKDGAVVKEYSCAEVDSVVYKPAAAQPRFYYYAGWDCPNSVEGTEETSLVKLIEKADGIHSDGGYTTSVAGYSSDRVLYSMDNTLTNPKGIRLDTLFIVIPNGILIYDKTLKGQSISNTSFYEVEDVKLDGYKIYGSNDGYYTVEGIQLY